MKQILSVLFSLLILIEFGYSQTIGYANLNVSLSSAVTCELDIDIELGDYSMGNNACDENCLKLSWSHTWTLTDVNNSNASYSL